MSFQRRSVSEIMQTEIAVLAPEEHLDLADDVMRLGRVRHMPVVEDGKLVGVVSSRDLLAASVARVFEIEESRRRTFLRAIQVKEVMATDVVAVGRGTSLREAATLMLDRKIGCLPVVDPDGTLVGLVTETDLLREALVEDRAGAAQPHTEGTMTDLRDRIAEEMEAVKRVRDELRVRMHLAKAEARDLWESTERKLAEVEAKLKLVSKEAEEPLHDVGEAARQLLREIRDGYRRIRDAL